ncbi:MAG: pilus assembly protein [Gammaproteobacteria bacterium]|nr:MAG: pilus assembly protein [Gammaproteobacteria bacterium]
MKLLKSNKNLNGQGMVEYLVIVGVIGIAALAAFTFMGGTVRSVTGGIAAQFVNQDASAAETQANLSATASLDEAREATQTTLGNFDTQNGAL